MKHLDAVIFNQNKSKKFMIKKMAIGFAFAYVIIGITKFFQYPDSPYRLFFAGMAILALVIMWLISRYLFRKEVATVADERLIKVYAYAYSYSWTSTIYLLVGLMITTTSAPNFIQGNDIIAILLVWMLLSLVGFSIYFNKREDI